MAVRSGVIRIHCLGGLSVRRAEDGTPLAGSAAQPRRMAILALLARAGSRGIPRERLLSLLWPDADGDRGPRTLTQALYALRQDLGSDMAISGTSELRLDPEYVNSDVGEFSAAVARGEHARADAVYAGPFLDGFHLPGLDAFERWVENERLVLATDYGKVLEHLARDATKRGDAVASAQWWRKLASLDPLNARVAIGLMQALVATNDRAGALRHARVYEVLLAEELELPPDREVVALAAQLRKEANDAPAAVPVVEPAIVEPVAVEPAFVEPAVVESAVVEPALVASTAAPTGDAPTRAPVVVAQPDAPPAPLTSTSLVASSRFGINGSLVVLVAIAVVVGVMTFLRSPTATPPTALAEHVVAVGRISEYQPVAEAGGAGAPLSDMLATNLARVPGLHVISSMRMLELAHQAGAANDTSAGSVIRVARAAGATDLIDGTVYRRSATLVRLDLRRVDVATGAIIDARTVEGADLFALVDSGTARLAAALGSTASIGSVASVTTHSDAAYQLYVQGLRRYYEMDWRNAERLFAASLQADSTFAMAAYFLSLSTDDAAVATTRIARAVRLSTTASERERLIIHADAAMRLSSPELTAFTDSLVARYPDEIATQLYRGQSLMLAEEYYQAIPFLRRVIAMDSLGAQAASERPTNSARVRPDAAGASPSSGMTNTCYACTAFSSLVYAYLAVDSSAAAEREAVAWTRQFPKAPGGWFILADRLAASGRHEDALRALRTGMAATAGVNDVAPEAFAVLALTESDYGRADTLLHALLETGTPAAQAAAQWYLAIAARDRGRLTEAIAHANANCLQSAQLGRTPSTGPMCISLLTGAMLEDAGRHREAVAQFTAFANSPQRGTAPSSTGRATAWGLTQAATSLAAAGDTAPLVRLADSIEHAGTRSVLRRDQQLHHYARGLLNGARRQDAAALTEFEQLMRSRTRGFSRVNFAMSEVLMRLGRPRDAIALLQPVVRGEIEGPALYLSRTVAHERLAHAWESAGNIDSAAAHYGVVARLWSDGDPAYAARATLARRWLETNRRRGR